MLTDVSSVGFGGRGLTDTLPKALAELQGLKIQVVAGTSGSLMAIAAMEADDTIVAIVNLTDDADVDLANVTINDRRASGKITCLSTAVAGDYVVVHGKRYTFRDVEDTITYNQPPGDVPFTFDPSGSDPEQIADRLAKAIMSGDSSLTCTLEEDTSSPPLLAVVRVTDRTAGVAGNSITMSESGDAVTVDANLTGGEAAGGGGFTSSDNLSGKALLVVWFDKDQVVLPA